MKYTLPHGKISLKLSMQEHVPDWCEKLQNSQNVSEDQNDSDSCYSEQLPEQEEWMDLADIVPGSFINTTKEIPQPDCNNYDWHGDRRKYADCLIREIPSWIKLKKDTFSVALPQQNIDINTFSDMQAHAYNMVKVHSQHPCPKDQLLSGLPVVRPLFAGVFVSKQ
jgi:hypothetical protein